MLVWATDGLVLVSKKSGMSCCVPLDFSLFSSWTSKREPSDINFQLEWIMIDCCHTKCVIKSAYELPTKYDRFQNIWKWDQQVRTLQTENITHSFHMLTLTLASGTLKVSGRGHRRLSSLHKPPRIEIVCLWWIHLSWIVEITRNFKNQISIISNLRPPDVSKCM